MVPAASDGLLRQQPLAWVHKGIQLLRRTHREKVRSGRGQVVSQAASQSCDGAAIHRKRTCPQHDRACGLACQEGTGIFQSTYLI